MVMAAPAISLAVRHSRYPCLVRRTSGMQSTRWSNPASAAQRIVALSRARTRPGTVRRLAMLAEDKTLARTGRWSELLAVIERHGGRALAFTWRRKAALAVATVLGMFLADPEAFPQSLLARCLPQREHDRQPCARRCRRTEACKTAQRRSLMKSLELLSQG